MRLTVATGRGQAQPGRPTMTSAAGTMASMIGRLHHLILDCPDPLALATFYSEPLGQPVTYRSDNFVVVAENDTTSGLAFQLAPDHQPPDRPDPGPAAADALRRDGGRRGRIRPSRAGPRARENSGARASTLTRPVIRSA